MTLNEDIRDALLVIIDFVLSESRHQPLPLESYETLNRAAYQLHRSTIEENHEQTE